MIALFPVPYFVGKSQSRFSLLHSIDENVYTIFYYARYKYFIQSMLFVSFCVELRLMKCFGE
jgi:hypothetical protein